MNTETIFSDPAPLRYSLQWVPDDTEASPRAAQACAVDDAGGRVDEQAGAADADQPTAAVDEKAPTVLIVALQALGIARQLPYTIAAQAGIRQDLMEAVANQDQDGFAKALAAYSACKAGEGRHPATPEPSAPQALPDTGTYWQYESPLAMSMLGECDEIVAMALESEHSRGRLDDRDTAFLIGRIFCNPNEMSGGTRIMLGRLTSMARPEDGSELAGSARALLTKARQIAGYEELAALREVLGPGESAIGEPGGPAAPPAASVPQAGARDAGKAGGLPSRIAAFLVAPFKWLAWLVFFGKVPVVRNPFQ